MKGTLRPLLLFAGIASATAFGGQIVLAEDASPEQIQREPHDHRSGHRGHSFRKLANKLGLSDQQKTQIQAIYQDSRTQARPYFVSIMTERRALQTLIQSGTADEAAIRAQAAKIACIGANLAVLRAQEARAFLALLTPDQVAKFNAIQAARDARFQKFVTRMTNDHRQ